MFDFMMTKEQIKIRDEARDFVKWVPRQMILDMDTDKIKFLRSSCRRPAGEICWGAAIRKMGGKGFGLGDHLHANGRGGTLGYEFACVFGVGAELVCDAIILHGTDEQKEKYVKPLLKGEIFAAECLTSHAAARISSGLQPKLKIRANIFF